MNPNFKYIENWNNLNRWFPSNKNTVSSNRLYSGGTSILDPAGGNYPVNIGPSDRVHVKTTLTLVGSGVNYVAMGVTQAFGNTAAGASSCVLWGLDAAKVRRYSNGGGLPATSYINNIAGNQPSLSAGTYQLSIIMDDATLTFSLTNADHSVHYVDSHNRSSFNSNAAFTGIVAWNSDTRHTNGSYFGPLEIEYMKSPSASLSDIGDSMIQLPLSGQPALITVPPDYDDATPAPLVIYCHGSGGNALSVWGEPNIPTVGDALTNAGYIVASSDAHGNNWGNQSSLDDLYGLYQYVNEHYNISSVVMLGHSMGGLDALLAIPDGQIPNIKAFCGIYPVTNLANMYGGGSGTYAPQINSAYNIPGSGSYATQTAGHDPNLLSGSVFDGIGMRFYASSSDTTVSKTNNSDAMASLVSGYATENSVVACSGNHGDASHFQPSDVVDFFNRCI